MGAHLEQAIAASDALTVRWIEATPAEGNMVLSGACVWPLLAFLASGASDAVRKELERALGLSTEVAFEAAKDLVAVLEADDELRAAIGVWVRQDVPIRVGWRRALPSSVLGALSGTPARDQAELDAWVHDRSSGMLSRLPIAIHSATLLVVAEVLALRTTWVTPFLPIPLSPEGGPWSEHVLDGLMGWSEDLDLVTIAETDVGPVTMFRTVGTGDVDVYLALGQDAVPVSRVLASAIPAVGRADSRNARELGIVDRPPGLSVREEWSTTEKPPSIRIRTVRSDIDSDHDLMDVAEVFGLQAAIERTDAFDRMSETALALDQARQSARSSFTATGFEAAAATAMGIALGLAKTSFINRVIEVTFDRPFGFFARHREVGITLFAGWVHDPALHPDRDR